MLIRKQNELLHFSEMFFFGSYILLFSIVSSEMGEARQLFHLRNCFRGKKRAKIWQMYANRKKKTIAINEQQLNS